MLGTGEGGSPPFESLKQISLQPMFWKALDSVKMLLPHYHQRDELYSHLPLEMFLLLVMMMVMMMTIVSLCVSMGHRSQDMHVEFRGQLSAFGFLFVPCFEPGPLVSAFRHTLGDLDPAILSPASCLPGGMPECRCISTPNFLGSGDRSQIVKLVWQLLLPTKPFF